MTETWTADQYQKYMATRQRPHEGQPKKPASNKCVTQMKMLLQIHGIEFVEEHVFHPKRKWRFDLAIPEKKIAIEYEGGVFGGGKSRHTTGKGFTEDAAKYNEAAKLGWKVLRYTAKGYSKLIEDLKPLL